MKKVALGKSMFPRKSVWLAKHRLAVIGRDSGSLGEKEQLLPASSTNKTTSTVSALDIILITAVHRIQFVTVSIE